MSIKRFTRIGLDVRALVLLAVGCVAGAVYFVLPQSAGAESLRVAAPVIGFGAVLFGLAPHRPERSRPWGFVAASLACLAAAHVTWAARFFRDEPTFPSVADAFHLAAAALLLAALIGRHRGRRDTTDSLGEFAVAIIAIARGVAVWLSIVEPYLADADQSLAATLWAAAVPLIGAVSVAIAVRLAADTGFRPSASSARLVGATVLFGADLLRSVTHLGDGFVAGGAVAALGVIAPLMIAAAALDPSMDQQHERAAGRAATGPLRTVGLSVAVLTPLTALVALIASDLGTATTRLVLAAAAIVAVVLALVRMWALVADVRDLTERRGQDRLAAMVEHSSDVVMLVDEVGDIKYASPGLSGTLGHRADDWIGRPLIDLIAEEDRDAAGDQLDELFTMGTDATLRFESSLVRVDGQRRRMETTFANLLGGDAVDGVVATFRDITEQRDLERRLSHRAFHDELTGLANRALFLDRMDHALRVARPDLDPVVVLFVDLDDFKSVNDALGHAVGDQLLRTVADRIRAASGPGDTPARLGGDEFALLLEDRGGVDRALEVAERLLEQLREPVHLAGYDLAVLASVGVAVAAPGMTTSSLLRDADIAMYEAKRAGKGQIKIFAPAMRLGATTQLEYRSELGSALEQRQLRLVYQPMIDLLTGEVHGAEALLRWHHPTRGEVRPDEFIPVAERSGLIKEIGQWVLHEAMREAVRWQVGGERYVSVNVSAVQLRDETFVAQVEFALRDTGLDPARVLLEVTETVLVDEIEAATTSLSALRDLGVRIGIDDFGTGYCSLSYLQKFPVDVVKIDREFVDEVDGDVKRSSLARMILQMTSSMGVTSVAEGIERPAQITALQLLGCDVGQGFLLSRPLERDVVRAKFGAAVPVGQP